MNDHAYSLESTKAAALEIARVCSPRTVQAILNRLKADHYEDDDLNRRAVLYLLDQKDLVIDREQQRVRLATEPRGLSDEQDRTKNADLVCRPWYLDASR